MKVHIDKIGSATNPIDPGKLVKVETKSQTCSVGDVIVVRALSESVSYGHLELPSGRLAKINKGDVLLGVLGKRKALKGFVGDVPQTVAQGDRLNLLNMGGVIGECKGHHSSLSDALSVEVIGMAIDEFGLAVNISDGALRPTDTMQKSAPLVVVGGSCMNTGKTVAAVEIIKQASNAGLKAAGAKLSGIACLRDTLNMEDHGAIATASFLNCGLPSTVDCGNLAGMAKAIVNHLNSFDPDLIVIELGDGIVGGYSVESVLRDCEFKAAISSFVFCAADYVGVIGGISVLKDFGIEIDVVAGSVTDSNMGEDFVREHYCVEAGNARRDGVRLFELVRISMDSPVVWA